MKNILILVIGCNLPPWDKMAKTSMVTWDSIQVPGVETIYYYGEPVHSNTYNCIYFPIPESYHTMGRKMLAAFQWVLDNKSFDYIARVNSSCYVNKKELLTHIQTLPDTNLFSGLKVTVDPPWMWGGGNFIISKDVIQQILNHQESWRHDLMEDMAISYLINDLRIPYHQGKACSIDKADHAWKLMPYGSSGLTFGDFQELKGYKDQFFFRVKQDYNRSKDEYVMKELFKYL